MKVYPWHRSCLAVETLHTSSRPQSFCILWIHSVKQSTLCSVQLHPVTDHVSAATKRLFFRTAMDTLWHHCGLSAILAPSKNVVAYSLTFKPEENAILVFGKMLCILATARHYIFEAQLTEHDVKLVL